MVTFKAYYTQYTQYSIIKPSLGFAYVVAEKKKCSTFEIAKSYAQMTSFNSGTR